MTTEKRAKAPKSPIDVYLAVKAQETSARDVLLHERQAHLDAMRAHQEAIAEIDRALGVATPPSKLVAEGLQQERAARLLGELGIGEAGVDATATSLALGIVHRATRDGGITPAFLLEVGKKASPSLTESALHTALHRLRKNELIAQRSKQRGSPYVITQKGREQLSGLVELFHEHIEPTDVK